MNTRPWWIPTALLLAFVYLVGYLGFWRWMVCRVEVPPGSSLQVRYKGPWPFGRVTQAPEGSLAQVDKYGRPLQVGVLEAMPGPGRHFYSPLEYETTLVPDQLIKPGQLGVVTSKVGKSLPAGQFLADSPEYRGVLRRVLTPGRHRINPYAFDVQIVDISKCVATHGGVTHKPGDPLLIPAGYVGVVTNKTDDPRTGQKQGTQTKVLQPGIYYLNPYAKRVDILSIGYNETTLNVETVKNADGTPRFQPADPSVASPDGLTPLALDPIYLPGKGVVFPSADSWPIHLDFTAIWGIMPDQAAGVIQRFGSAPGAEQNILKVVERNVILPQVDSIARLNGSRHGAIDLLVGDSREAFQTDVATELARVLEENDLELRLGLTRHLYVPARIREPIQRAKIAEEETLTRKQEQLTAEAEGELKEARARVEFEKQRVEAETEKVVASEIAKGDKESKEIEAETEKLAAQVDAQTALIKAKIKNLLGEAEAKKTELANQAEAERFQQYVSTLGGPEAYNRYMFAEGLPSDMRLGIFYAGQGTLWTDLKGFEQTMLGKLASESESADSPEPRPAASTTPASLPIPAPPRR